MYLGYRWDGAFQSIVAGIMFGFEQLMGFVLSLNLAPKWGTSRQK